MFPVLKVIPTGNGAIARRLGRSAAKSVRRPRFRPGMVWTLAWRNLVHDRVRFGATLVGISFSVVLMAVQWGLLIGFANTAAGLVTHAGADFWVMSRGTSNADQTVPLPERWRFKALSVPGVATVDPLIVRFVDWRRPDGRSEIVIVVGFDLDGVGGPWNVTSGSIEDLRAPDAIMLDRLYAEKLGIRAIGQTVEISGRRARVVGFTDGIRAFTQSPYIFTSFKNAQQYARFDEGQTSYLLVRAAARADQRQVGQLLSETLPSADIRSTATFASMTSRYWLLTTGAGLAMVVGAGLGVIVGIAIVAQTLYAATVERLPEYATLAAIGAQNRYLNQIVLRQALISGVFGYVFGIIAAAFVVQSAADSTASLVLPWQLAVAVGSVALIMCGLAALLAIHKIKTIDPTTVFR